MVSTTNHLPKKKFFFDPLDIDRFRIMHKTHFTTPPPPCRPITKIKNPAKWGYSPMETPYQRSFFFESLQYISYLYIVTKRESRDNPTQNKKGASSQGKGVYHPRTHTPDPAEITICEPTPPGDPCCVPLLTFVSSSASRFHTQGNKRSKSNRNGLLFPTQHRCSIAVTNRETLWKYLPNIYVNNFVRNYSLTLLPIQYGFRKAFIVSNYVRNFIKALVE